MKLTTTLETINKNKKLMSKEAEKHLIEWGKQEFGFNYDMLLTNYNSESMERFAESYHQSKLNEVRHSISKQKALAEQPRENKYETLPENHAYSEGFFNCYKWLLNKLKKG